MSINASKIKELREKTGAGILDCKSALTENQNDLQKAIDWLRKKGLSVAAKKSGRVAAEGLIATKIENNKGCIVEINSETDFVSSLLPPSITHTSYFQPFRFSFS